jgi:hypothetical protein
MLQLLNRDSSSNATVVQPPLSQAVGYIIVVVVGMIIATGRFFLKERLQKIFTDLKLACSHDADHPHFE